MAAQSDIGAWAGFGVASVWQEAVVTSAARAVAMHWKTGDQLDASNAAISTNRIIDDSIADAAGDIKDLIDMSPSSSDQNLLIGTRHV